MKSQQRQQMPRSVRRPAARDTHAFTRLEVAAVLAALGLLALLVLPALANNRGRSTRVVCVNNLRQAGQALQQWGTEHSERLPWRTPWCEGGTMPPSVTGSACSGSPIWVGLNQNPWFQWAWISNELRSPNILACPSDTKKKPASTWSSSPSDGFTHANFQNKAVSYLMGLDVLPDHTDGLVAGDRNVRFDVVNQSCSSGLTSVFGLNRPNSVGINSELHVEAGNYLFKDGRVEQLSSRGFVAMWQVISSMDDNATFHFLPP